jgi:hypothetical protein
MIIDLILDRKDNKVLDRKAQAYAEYSPKRFYEDVTSYGEIGFTIAEAMDNGTEIQVKEALASYIRDNEYNWQLIKYIHSVNWL